MDVCEAVECRRVCEGGERGDEVLFALSVMCSSG